MRKAVPSRPNRMCTPSSRSHISTQPHAALVHFLLRRQGAPLLNIRPALFRHRRSRSRRRRLVCMQILRGMAKERQPKFKGVPNKHLHARTTFLYQAATHLTLRAGAVEPSEGGKPPVHSTLAQRLASDLHTVSRKGQVRLSSELKRSICKTCHTALVPGRTATQAVVNESKQSKKPWADVLIINCNLCGTHRRFPIGAKRQQRKGERSSTASVQRRERGSVHEGKALLRLDAQVRS